MTFKEPSGLNLKGILSRCELQHIPKMQPYFVKIVTGKDLITTVIQKDINIDVKKGTFNISIEEILKDWYQFDNYTIIFYLKDIKEIEKNANKTISDEECDYIVKVPLCILPDSRIELSKKKKQKIEELDAEEEEEIIDN